MKPIVSRSLVAGLIAATALTGAAQAAPLNIWSASRAQEASSPQLEQVQRRYYRGGYRGGYRRGGINPGAAAAIGVIGGLAAGAAIANSRDRYYDDGYYDDGYYAQGPAYRSGPVYSPGIGNCSDRPNNYPTDQC